MQTMGAFAVKTHFSALLDQVEGGDEIVITKHGRPVAKLLAFRAPKHKEVVQAIKRLKELSKKNSLGDLDWKTLRDEGRR